MFSITEAMLRTKEAISTRSGFSSNSQDSPSLSISKDSLVDVELTESIGHVSSISNVDLASETELFHRSQSLENVAELRNVIATLYGRLLEFVNRLVEMDENTLSIISKYDRQVRTLKVKLIDAKDNQRHVQLELEQLKGNIELVEIRELEKNENLEAARETASTLTEWNSRLEEQVQELTDILATQKDQLRSQLHQLDQQILMATEKRINLRCEYNKIEEDNLRLRQSLHEQKDIQNRLLQENAILKSKLFSKSDSGSTYSTGTTVEIEPTQEVDDHRIAIEIVNSPQSNTFSNLASTSNACTKAEGDVREVDKSHLEDLANRKFSMAEMEEKAVYFENVDLSNQNIVMDVISKVSEVSRIANQQFLQG